MCKILKADRYRRATLPLKRTVDALELAAGAKPGLTTVAEPGREKLEPQNEKNPLFVVKNPRFDPLLNPANPGEENAYKREYVRTYVDARKAGWAAHMERHIRGTYPRATPTDDAVSVIDRWLLKAIEIDYPVYDTKIRELLCSVILSHRTDGYTDEDTTGTQMGNFQGEWRGGGFGQ